MGNQTAPGGELGDAEERGESRVAAISTSLYWAPLFARLHKRREPKTGGLIFRAGQGKRGCGGTRKLAPLKSCAVPLLSESQDGRERSKKRREARNEGKVEADKSDHQALSCEKLPRP